MRRGWLFVFVINFYLLPPAMGAGPSPSPMPASSPSSAPSPGPPASPELPTTAKATLISAPENKGSIQNLSISNKDLIDVQLKAKGEDFEAWAVVDGKYTNPEWGLILDSKPVKLRDKGAFRIEVPLKGRVTSLNLQAVGPLAEVEEESFRIVVPQWDSFKKGAEKNPPKRLNVSAGPSFTFLSLAQTGRDSFSEVVLTVKCAVNYLIFPPLWDFGGNVYFNALPVTTSAASGGVVRMLGANIRFGFALKFIPEPWRVSILPGIGYSTMIGSGAQATFGYHNLTWPQIYPTARRIFKNGQSAFVYAKFASLADGSSNVFANGEIAFGGGWVIPLANTHPVSISFDYSGISVSFGTRSRVKATSYNLGASYGF